ncbi:MAG: leucine-rich repeat protein [Clostridia bacterium]|nr:leucine-rich repeat protein [Clostridia bacterium]
MERKAKSKLITTVVLIIIIGIMIAPRTMAVGLEYTPMQAEQNRNNTLLGEENDEKVEKIGNEEYTYEVNDDGKTAKITMYSQDEITKATTIPAKIGNYKVVSIDNYAFAGQINLTSITISPGITSIGNGVFAECKDLTSITIPDSVTSIGGSAFSGCSSLTSITIPNSVTSIGYRAFSKCSSLTKIKNLGNITTIEDNMFLECTSLTSITIPDSVTSISYGGFYGCSSLANITISENVTSIETDAFYGCSSLTSITIPRNTTKITGNVFLGCKKMSEIVVEEDNEAFASNDGVLFSKDMTNLICYPAGKKGTDYIIPKDVIFISKNAFSGSGLKNITIPENVNYIDNTAFNECENLQNIIVNKENHTYTSKDGILFKQDMSRIERYPAGKEATTYEIPEEVLSISMYAFYGCNKLTNITIPDSVTKIDFYAFSGCGSLTSITIPKNTTTVEGGAFTGCTKMNKIVVAKENEQYISKDGVLFNKDMTDLICYPAGKKDTIYTVPDSVTSIKLKSFDSCNNLKGLVIPKTVTDINYTAFANCSNLTIICDDDSVARETAYYESLPYITSPIIEGVKDGSAYNKEVTPVVKFKEVCDVKLYKNGKLVSGYSSGNKVTEDGKYEIKAKYGVGTESSIKFTIDKSALKVEVSYSTTEPTYNDVKVTIKSDMELKKLSGWTLSKDKKALTKTYTKNTSEKVKVEGTSGNSATVQVTIKNIDKTAPKIEGVKNGQQYLKPVTITVTDENLNYIELYKNEKEILEFKSGDKISAVGSYEIIAWDKAHNVTRVKFEITDRIFKRRR